MLSNASADSRFSSEALLTGQGENGDRKPESQQLVEQSSLLPTGALSSAEPDKDVIRGKARERILERDYRIVRTHRSAYRPPKFLFELAENRPQPLVGLHVRLVRG